MKLILFLGFLSALVLQSDVFAQPVAAAASAREGLIVYLYSPPGLARCIVPSTEAAGAFSASASLQHLVGRLQASGRSSQLQIFTDISAPQDFVLLQSFSQPSLNPDAGAGRNGWNRDFFPDSSDCLAKARLFELPSTFLLGDRSLKVRPDSLVVIQHVDVDPKMRELYQPYFQQLARVLKGQSGFEGFQVWTWNSRPNHWTVISVWRDLHTVEAAQHRPELVAVWDQIFANAASPRNWSNYRRFDMNP